MHHLAARLAGIARLARSAGRLRRCERGSFYLEFALVAPFLIMLTIGAIDFGGAAQELSRIASAARAGAQFGAAAPDNATNTAAIVQAARDDAADSAAALDVDAQRFCECPDGTPVACDSSCAGAQPRIYVQVDVATTYSTLVPYPLIPATWSLSRSAVLRAQ